MDEVDLEGGWSLLEWEQRASALHVHLVSLSVAAEPYVVAQNQAREVAEGFTLSV
jgi:hypothetical protein